MSIIERPRIEGVICPKCSSPDFNIMPLTEGVICRSCDHRYMVMYDDVTGEFHAEKIYESLKEKGELEWYKLLG